MVEIIKTNESKYSKRGAIKLDSIPIEDTELALEEFSEGSISLCKCLRAMWMRNLKTHSSYADVKEKYDIAHITMEEKVDLFSYLSPVLLDDEMVQLDFENDRQVIRFAGNKARIEAALLSLTRDIMSGKKRNNKEVREKLFKPFPEDWLNEYDSYYHNNKVKQLA